MRLSDYDLVVLNTSGGKDSQTAMRVMVEMARAQGYPLEKMVAVHADLRRVEWKGAKETAEAQAKHYGLRFEWITREKGDLLDQVLDRGMWPSSSARFCTSDHKRDQVQKVLVKEGRSLEQDQIRILNVIGLRAEESPARAKREILEHNKRASTKTRTVVNYHPILSWTEKEVWESIHDSGVVYHPAYDLGMSRLSCVFCVFASESDLLIAGRHNRELLEEYVRVEKKIGHTFKHGFEISSILEKIKAEEKVAA